MNYVVALLALLALSACSTSVDHRMVIPYGQQGTLKISDVKASVSGLGVADGVPAKLEQAVTTELQKRQQGTRVVALKLDIRSMHVVSAMSRFFIGAFGGSNTMVVGVKVVDPKKGIIADFDIARTANPGGTGAYFDQEADTIREVAEGIVKTLYGES